jgi:hypothetical protein
MRKDFDSAAWATAHNEDFQRLVQEARHRSSRKADNSEPAFGNPEAAMADDVTLHQVTMTDQKQPSRSEERVNEADLACGHDSADFKTS